MLKFDFEPELRGLNLVTIEEISIKTNSKGDYIDIHVSKNGKEHHLFNNINESTKGYVIAQLINLGNQLELEAMSSDELLEAVKGKEAEIEATGNKGFHINPYKTIFTQEEAMDM